MTGSPEQPRAGEFETITRCFAPLAENEPGALSLSDDAAVLKVKDGHRLVVTMDTLVRGVHFPSDSTPQDIALRLLAVNLSDLAAMGATPAHYTLSLALPEDLDDAWLDRFAAALGAEQKSHGITLVGGDTVATPGPLCLTLTALGWVVEGQELRRSGARPGDTLYVSGTLGDAALGLLAARKELPGLDSADTDYLVRRFHRPRPRVDLGRALAGIAHGCIDISDGLIADAGHIAEASSIAVEVEWERLPLSPAAAAAVDRAPGLRQTVLGGGDDYELLFTAPGSAAGDLARISARLGLPLTAIGRITGREADPRGAGGRVRVLDGEGMEIIVASGGYRHF